MTINEKDWTDVTAAVAAAFRLTEDELASLRSIRTAKLFAAIPYIAGCDHPKRTATASLSAYMLALNPHCESICAHTPEDDSDPFRRMFHAVQYSGGTQTIIERGKRLLLLVQLKDHQNDRESDAAAGVYNPVNAGAWNFDKMYEDLIAKISAVSCPEMDAVMPVGEDTDGWWDGG